nr:transposase [Streptomyces wuyuanensis]
MRVPLPPLVTPRVLGVDDFALYGTPTALLVGASTRLPAHTLGGTRRGRLSRWLREHPGVEVACRDGSLTYRQGVAGGAPGAVQVSDRFHFWQGIIRRVQDTTSTHRGCLSAGRTVHEAAEASLPEPGSARGANPRTRGAGPRGRGTRSGASPPQSGARARARRGAEGVGDVSGPCPARGVRGPDGAGHAST